QAEDGIRDRTVTGVQTCALPIFALEAARALREDVEDQAVAIEHPPLDELLEVALLARGKRVIDEDDLRVTRVRDAPQLLRLAARSEERRVGKECRCRGAA